MERAAAELRIVVFTALLNWRAHLGAAAREVRRIAPHGVRIWAKLELRLADASSIDAMAIDVEITLTVRVGTGVAAIGTLADAASPATHVPPGTDVATGAAIVGVGFGVETLAIATCPVGGTARCARTSIPPSPTHSTPANTATHPS